MKISIIGASGFIGRHLLQSLLAKHCHIRLLQHSTTSPAPVQGVTHYRGDLSDPLTLGPFLDGTDVLINLAWPTAAEEEPQQFAGHLASACIENGVKRLVHVSTAMVIGRPETRTVDENTPPKPRSRYEKSKLLVEQNLRTSLDSQVDLAILRPTAVFGAGSRNLEQLARRMLAWPLWSRYLLRFVYGQRNMHLVPVEDVVRAIELLAFHGSPLLGQAFIVAQDAHPMNHYQGVDELLAPALGVPLLRSKVRIPAPMLHALLRLSRRSQDDPRLHISGTHLASLGFVPSRNFERAVAEYGRWYALQKQLSP